MLNALHLSLITVHYPLQHQTQRILQILPQSLHELRRLCPIAHPMVYRHGRLHPPAHAQLGIYDNSLSRSVQVGDPMSTQPDEVQITYASFDPLRRCLLTVSATSSAAPDAKLTVWYGGQDLGLMKYDRKMGRYTFSERDLPYYPEVTVTSSFGGSATLEVEPQ